MSLNKILETTDRTLRNLIKPLLDKQLSYNLINRNNSFANAGLNAVYNVHCRCIAPSSIFQNLYTFKIHNFNVMNFKEFRSSKRLRPI